MPPQDAATEEQGIPGEFWLPEAEDTRVPGRLVLSDNSAPVVKLYGSLTSATEVVNSSSSEHESVVEFRFRDEGPENESLVVYGLLNQSPRQITLVDCFTRYRTGDLFGSTRGEQHLQALYGIRGGHVSGLNEEFEGVRVRLQNLDIWSALPGFQVVRGEDGSVSLTFTPPQVPATALQTGEQLTLSSFLTYSPPRLEGGHIRRRVYMEVTGLGSLTWREIGRKFVTPLASIATLAAGMRCPVTEVRLLSSHGDWLLVINPSFVAEDSDEAQRSRSARFLLNLPMLTLPAVARWLDLVEKLGPIPPVVADVTVANRLTLETQLLELTTVAEGLHSRLFPDEQRMPEDAAARIRSKVDAALQDEDDRYRQVVRGSLSYLAEPSYANRLDQLADEVRNCAPGVTGDTKKWVQNTVQARNDFTHRRTGFLTKEDVDRYFTLMRSLRPGGPL